MCKDFTFNFEREEIEKQCEGYATLNEQIRYLECVLKEYKTNPPDLDLNYGISPTFEEWIEGQLRWFRYLLNEPESKVEGLVKIQGRFSDIVRIFEAMIAAQIISTKTEVTQIVRLFFNDALEAKKFTDQYYARKDDIADNKRMSRSPELKQFIINLIENSFNQKNDVLREFSNHIDNLL